MQEINVSLANDLGNSQELLEELGEIGAYYEQHEGYAVEYRVKQILRGLSLKEELWEQKIKIYPEDSFPGWLWEKFY